jgi:long-chain-fatty-acid--CoA ligase ACSBG
MSYITIFIVVVFVIVCVILRYQQNNQNACNISYSTQDGYVLSNDKNQKKFTILDVLKKVAEDHPKQSALKVKNGKVWKSITYATYYKKVKNFAQSLNMWLGSNVNVGIIGFNSTGWLYSHLGTMLNGGASVGIYSTASAEVCEHIVENANIEMLVVENDKQLEKFIGMDDVIKLIVYYTPVSAELVKKFSIPVISMGNFMTETTKLERAPSLTDVATIIYTSGTTSSTNDMPKGVIITHSNIMNSVTQMVKTIKTKSSMKSIGYEQLISYLPLNHIAAQMMDIYLPITCISTVWFADTDALKGSLGKTIKEVKPTMFIGMPRVWEKIQESVQEGLNKNTISGTLAKTFTPWKIIDEIGLDRCKLCITCAAPISETARDFFMSIGIKLYDMYGLTETCGVVSVSACNMSRNKSVGMPTMSVKIANDNEILVKGKNVFSGYYGMPKETTKSFTKDGWFKTGDLGKLDTDGFLYVTGRKKELIITAGGENINPNSIESFLKEKIGNMYENIIVIGDKKKFLVVLLNTDKKDANNDQAIENAISYANSHASSNAHTIKKFLVLHDKFKIGNELTPTMKIRRAYIQEKYEKQINKLYKE